MPVLRLCIISPSLKLGGIERALTVLAEQFYKKGIKVDFVSCLKGDRFYQLPDSVCIHEPPFLRTASFLNKIIYYPRLLYYIRKKVRELDPDRVLAFGDWFSPLVLFALYGTKFPVYISDRTSPDYKFKFPIPQLKKWLYPSSKGFIAQTQRAADFKRKQFGDKLNIRIIPNAIRDVKLHPEIQREQVILYLGRFAWEKAPDRLIKAFADIKEKTGWQLHMAGQGPMLEEMNALTKSLNIDDSVVFLGHVKDVDRLFARASIFVLPSVIEGFPNALCEAMAAGLPCICYDTIPHEDIIQNGHDGVVVEGDAHASLSRALEELMNSSAKRDKFGKEALKASERFKSDKIATQVLEFICER